MRSILHVEHLVKYYAKAGAPAIDDISFTIQPGEFFVCLGGRGAGKSTLIAILATTLPRTSGRVMVAGYDLDQQATEIRQEIGVVHPKLSLDSQLSAEESIRHHVCQHGLYQYQPLYQMMPSSYRQRIEELTTTVELDCDLFQPLHYYSAVMQRKLAIIRSLMHDPLLLLLDEPTAHLDAQSRRDLWRYLRKLQRAKGVTVFLTTQDREEAEEADHVGILQRGRLVLEDSDYAADKGKQRVKV